MTIKGSCDCGARWESGAYCHCCLCHATLSSDTGHLLHLSKRGCSDPFRLRDGKGRRIFTPRWPKNANDVVWFLASETPTSLEREVSGRTFQRVTAPSPSGVAV